MEVRAVLFDRGGNNPLGDVSHANIRSIRHNEKTSDQMTFTLPNNDSKGGLIEDGETEIGVWLDGQPDPTFYGVIWDSQGGSSEADQFYCEDLESLFQFRYLPSSLHAQNILSYTSIDQATIAWDVLNRCQQATDGDMGIVSGYVPTGVNRTKEYHYHDFPSLSDMLNEFRTLDNGFDWRIKVFGDLRREWQAFYPKIGSDHPEWRVEWGKNIVSYSYKKDGRMINEATATGSGDGPNKLHQTYVDATRRAATGLRQIVFANSQIKSNAELLSKATYKAEFNDWPLYDIDVVIKNKADMPILSINPGDRLPVLINRGRLNIDAMFTLRYIDIDPVNETAKLGLEQRTDSGGV